MANFIELLNFFQQDDKQYNAFLKNLLTFDNDIPFKTEEINTINNAIISTINIQLNQTDTRYNGLFLLNAYLPKCSKDTLLKYGILWIAKATQVVENIYSNPKHLTIACKVIGNLITQCKTIPELQKQISMQNVKQLLNILDNLETMTIYGATYYLLATLLYHYPEVCERFQILIRKMILLQVDASQANLAEAGAKCFALLVRATERTFKPPQTKPFYTCWTYNQALICNSLHDIMDNLFSNLLEIESVDIWDKLELSSISEENIVEYYSKQKQRFTNLCIYLSTMLRGCEEKNSVLPDDILRILCRGLAIRPMNLRRQNSFKEQMLYLILPKLHISLFNVLSALIEGFKKELIPFGSTILQLFHQALKWSGNVLEDQETIASNKPYKHIRLSVYKCLSLWLITNNSLSGIETIIDESLSSILRDIIPERDRVVLTVQNATKNLSKKALKRFRDGQYEKNSALNNTVATKKNPYLDADLCIEALMTLQNILFSTSTCLKTTLYTNIQSVVIPLLYKYYLGSPTETFYKERAECRLQLLKILKDLQLNPHESSASSTQHAIQIFEMALNDSDLHIVQEARCALSELEKIIHPLAPTLSLPRTEEISNERDEICTIVSNEQENISNEEFTPPSNKRSKVISIVTLNSDERVHLDSGDNVTAKVIEKSTSIDSSKLEDSSLQKNKNIVNEVSFIEERNNEKDIEAELHNSLRIDQMPDDIENKQLENVEIKSTELDVEEIDHPTNLQQRDNNLETLEEKEDVLMDDEKQMLLTFHDQLKDN
ncbi:proline-, glutamic acid- and leucine-rich protein 1-like [Vespa velutina]|uniref:proline-, glutamic acid- and leucine-rich protein 1-like n=1 Tax=Vespa velutina TaxID=202808 RepID=UPI001FB4CA45|nr:proline-, glutamic acid- and leucine-rich protein 1-like [Vespa velutina]